MHTHHRTSAFASAVAYRRTASVVKSSGPAAPAVPVLAAVSVPATQQCLMQLTVATASVTALRGLVMRVCGDALGFMRIEACDYGSRMRVCLSVSPQAVGSVMDAVMRQLPQAEFGRLSGLPAAAHGGVKTGRLQ